MLSIKKSTTKKVKLGLDYQVEIPGKKIKRCSSSNKKIATVTDKGLIHTKKAGEVRITITLKKGSDIKLKLKVIDPTVPVWGSRLRAASRSHTAAICRRSETSNLSAAR